MILRVQQAGYVRSTGYQATEWAVTVPIAVPDGSPPLATSPASYAPLFVVDTSGPREVLRRVATLQDYAQFDRAELDAFEATTAGSGATLFDNARAGDTLRITPLPEHWLQEQAPYDTQDFLVSSVEVTESGSAPQAMPGNKVNFPGRVFAPADVGRWVKLLGFTTQAYNGWSQVVSYEGSVATVSRSVTTSETGGSWNFYCVKIDPQLSSGVEPRYFPTKMVNLGWELRRAGSFLTGGDSGGATRRDTPDPVVRSVRWTELAPTAQSARAVFAACAAQLAALQASASAVGTELTTLLTLTEGP